MTKILDDKYTEDSDRKKKQLENFANYFSWKKFGFVNSRYNKIHTSSQNTDLESAYETYNDFISEWEEYNEEFLGVGKNVMDSERMLNWVLYIVIKKSVCKYKEQSKLC